MTPSEKITDSSITEYFGRSFTISARIPDEEDFISIRNDLRSSMADRSLSLEEAEKAWKRIGEIQPGNFFYLLVDLEPESRLPAPFLELQFKLDEVAPVSVTSYYRVGLSSERNSGEIVLAYSMGNPGFYHGGMFPIMPVQGSRNIKWIHSYRYLLQFDSNTQIDDSSKLEVTIHNGKKILLRND